MDYTTNIFFFAKTKAPICVFAIPEWKSMFSNEMAHICQNLPVKRTNLKTKFKNDENGITFKWLLILVSGNIKSI